jgi:dimethylamine monooxygenase subunit A
MNISVGLTRLLPMPNVFRGEMTFRKSDAAILRFPFPLSSDGFTMTSVGAEPHDRTGPGPVYQSYFDIDEHYHDEMAERAFVLQSDRSRYQMLPHMEAAQWEATDYIMRALAQDFPAQFTYRRNGTACFWENRLMNESRSFTYGHPETLPYEAFEYITRQVQGDFVLMDQRQGNLWLDGGMVTASYGWSFDFILGMDWYDWHGMLMGAAAESRVIDRALRMTMMLQAEAPQRRVTWVHQVRARLDKSLENKIVWQHDVEGITRETLPDLLFVRSEFQQLYRLPHSNAVLFVLRNHLLSLRDVARVPKWAARLHRALRDLSPDLARYSSIFMRQDCVDWLSQFDDGRPLSPGGGPDTDHLEPRR